MLEVETRAGAIPRAQPEPVDVCCPAVVDRGCSIVLGRISVNATSRARLAGASLVVFLLTGVLSAGPGPLAVAPPTMPLVLHHVDLERYEEIQAASDWFF